MGKKNPMPEGRYEEVMRRDHGICQAHAYGWPTDTRCDGQPIIHHKKIRGMGGTPDPTIHDPEHLVVLCGGVTGSEGHHGEVHRRPADAYDCGLLIRRNGAT